MCLCFLVRRHGVGREVLLGRKKRGLGTGNIVGLGGKVEPGETSREAAVREVGEEAGIDVRAADFEHKASIAYAFPTKPRWDQDATVFVAERWSGEAVETDEIASGWYDVRALPLDEMWADARHWLPRVLAGERIEASFAFAADLSSLVTSNVTALPS